MVALTSPSPDDAPVKLHRPSLKSLGEMIASFGKLGLISFGGPIAHLGYYRAEFVEKRHWISDADYADLVVLCQFLPGPASSQVVFALGMQRAGILGGLVASICFALPSALLMIAFAYCVAMVGDLTHVGWLHGLKLAAVTVVAHAVWGMGKTVCPDRSRLSICLGAAAILLILPGAVAQLGVIAVGTILGWVLYRTELPVSPIRPMDGRLSTHLLAAGALVLYIALVLELPAIVKFTHGEPLAVFDSFYRSGALVFGGGHVVLPLQRAEVVPKGWVIDDEFLAGYGAAQAIPGRLFAFAAYLSTVMKPGRYAWVNGFWCLFAIFLPGWLLIGGALPFWHRLRGKPWVQASLREQTQRSSGCCSRPSIHRLIRRESKVRRMLRQH